MLLLDKENITVDSARKIVIVSDNDSVCMSVAQTLRTRGLENVDIIKEDFFTAPDLAFLAEETLGVIIDISTESDVKVISENVYAVIPQNVWCCVVGHNDSISLAQKLLNEGVLYFHSESQLSQLVEKIVSGVNIPLVRHTVKIAVLGCKGGIGSSLISSHLANEITLNNKVPVLLAQGPNGSQDIDLLFDKKIQGDIVEYNANFDLFSGNIARLPLSVTDKYNFIIYDQPIFNVNKENFASFFEYCNSFVLVVDRRINSLRVAKQFLDECERMRAATGKPIRTFICISDNNIETSKLMATTDIEMLLKCPVDATIPFLKKTDSKTVLSIDLGRVGKKEIDTLMMRVIGMVSRHKKKEKQSFFSSLMKK